LTTLRDERLASSGQGDALDLLALDEALRRLEALNPRRSTVVLLRLFGGLTVEEVARYLEVSTTSVKNHWRMAKAWLLAELDLPAGGRRDRGR
jgi:DNA-directed RNA polymerase specialized sigma24 family protein